MPTRPLTPVWLTALVSFCVSSLTVACASHPPPPPEVPVATLTPAPPPPPDVTAVPAPVSLVFWGRVSKPAASMRVATDWAHLPPLDPTALLQTALDGLTETHDNAALARAVDPNLPIDLVGAFDMSAGFSPMFAGAVAVTQLDQAKTALASRFDESPGENGVIHLKLKAEVGSASTEKEADPKNKPECELAPAAGAAPYRFVCATNHDALGTLAGYLTRTLPRQTIDSDFHIEMHAEPTKLVSALGRASAPKMLAGLLGLDATTQPATSELVSAVIGDLFDYMSDLDVITMDATLDPAQATLSMRTTFKSSTSLMARMQASRTEPVDVPPSTVLRLPIDVDLVSFAGGVDPADLQHPRDLAIAAATEQLDKAKLATADTRALADLIHSMNLGVKGVVAHGIGPASEKVDKPGAVPVTASYWLFERDEAAGPSQKMARALVALLGRPSLNKWWAEHVTKTRRLPSARITALPAGLPTGSLDVEVTTYPELPVTPAASSPKGKPAAKPTPAVVAKPTTPVSPRVYHAIIVPDGTRSWIAFSTSPSLARTRLASIVTAHPAAETLAARPGLEGFKEMRMGSGGFFTVKGFLGFAQDAFAEDKHAPKLEWARLLKALPAGGSTPILFTSSPGAPTTGDPGGQRDLRMTVPADAIRDAVRFGLAVSAE